MIKIIALEAEISELKKRITILEKENRELSKEVNDYVLRERQLINEIEKLDSELNIQNHDKPHKTYLPTAESVDEFLNPKLPGEVTRTSKKGLENEWDELMLAYTDEIFIESENPDLLFYRDDSENAYLSITGKTRLNFPISQATLDRFNILKIRKLTNKEKKDIIEKYNL